VKRAVALFAAVLAGASAVPAEALVACKTRAGAVFVRDACRRRETPLDLASLGTAGPAGAPGATGPQGRAAAYLADATNREPGPVVYAESFLVGIAPSVPYVVALVAHDALGGAALLPVDFFGNGAGTVSYASADCTGTPFVAGGNLTPMLAIVKDAVFRPTASSPNVLVQSTEIADPSQGCTSTTPRGGCCRTQGTVSTPQLAVAEATTLPTLGIESPFHVTAP
jgi:hypothetical protein